MDGVNVLPLFTGTGSIDDRPLYWHYPHYDETTPYSSAIVDGWKVVRYADDGKTEVYNLKDDPMEKNDLSTKNPEKTESLINSLDGYLADVGAQLALPDPDHDPSPDVFSGGIRDFKIWNESRKDK